jgi:hypothetical protein
MIRRVVLDTSVVVAGLRTRSGAGNAVLRLIPNRRLVALATPPLFLLTYQEGETMSKATYPLKLPVSIKKAASVLPRKMVSR